MKIVRFVLLALAVTFAALAAFLFARMSLVDAFPIWLLARFPSLSHSERWLLQDVLTIAVAATLLACLCFGLAVPAWESSGARRVRAAVGAAPMGRLAFALLLLLVMALAAALGLWQVLALPNGWLQSSLWLAGMALVPGTAAVVQRERALHIWGDDSGQPERSGPLLLVILLPAAFLYLWQGAWLPAVIPPESIAVGLQAQAQGEMVRSGLVAAGPAGLPWLATFTTALGLALARNPFDGLLWAGCATALALALATWLLGCELFRRAPVPGVDDDGRRPAVLGALATAILLPMLHFARLPTFLAPALWGTLGLWALLRAARTGSFPTVAAAGLLTGLALLMRPSGLVLVGAASVAWLSLALTRRRLLAADAGGIGWRGFWLWLAALAVAAAPALAPDEGGVANALAQWATALSGFGQGLTTTLAALNVVIGQPVTAPPLDFFPPLLGALFLLALGGLLFHVDQPIGWIVLGWLVLGVVAAAPLSQQAVDYGALAVLLPACGMALAFALDRAQAALARSLGTWVRSSAGLLSVGILLLAALINLRDYPARMGIHPDAATVTARIVAQAAPIGTPIALFADNAATAWDAPALRFARAGAAAAPLLPAVPMTDPAAWPATLPAGTHLLLPPEPSRQTLLLAQQRYPDGALHIVRDRHANPALYVYTLP